MKKIFLFVFVSSFFCTKASSMNPAHLRGSQYAQPIGETISLTEEQIQIILTEVHNALNSLIEVGGKTFAAASQAVIIQFQELYAESPEIVTLITGALALLTVYKVTQKATDVFIHACSKCYRYCKKRSSEDKNA